MRSVSSKTISRGLFALAVLAGVHSHAECVSGKLGELKSSPVLSDISELLRDGNSNVVDLKPGFTYQWQGASGAQPIRILVDSAAPNALNVVYDGTNMPIDKLCAEGAVTSLIMQSKYGQVQIKIEK